MGKKTPASNTCKKVRASARAKISTRKVRKQASQVDGSYLQDNIGVSTVDKLSEPMASSSSSASNADILQYLQKIDASTQALACRVEHIEHTANSTPIQIRQRSQFPDVPADGFLQAMGQGSNPSQTLRFQEGVSTHHSPQGSDQVVMSGRGDRSDPLSGQIAAGLAANPRVMPVTGASDDRDAILPDINVIRNNPNISDAVSRVLASYDQQSRLQAIQGKPHSGKKSGCFNLTDLCTALPEARWPNEGFQSSGNKRIGYDDLTLPQWAAGQLTNVLQIKDTALMKQALLQVVLSLRDATSLPWPVVRGAWAMSMHELEDGRLGWNDATQWSLNRASQISMVNQQTAPQRKVCRYYNEGSCSHDGHHGQFRHNCSFCARSGRYVAHPEVKCFAKNKGQDKVIQGK